MLNHEVCGWGQFRKFSGITYELFHEPTMRQYDNISGYRKEIRKYAKEQGHTHVRVVSNTYGEYATYVYPTIEELDNEF